MVLSSGFLAFAAHAGFLQAVEEVRRGGVGGGGRGRPQSVVAPLHARGHQMRECRLESVPVLKLLVGGSAAQQQVYVRGRQELQHSHGTA